MTKLLVVDADRELAAILSFTLERAGFAVSMTANVQSASRIVVEEEPSLVLLDAGLADDGALELLRDFRARGRSTGVMLTGHGDENARVLGLESGADDYVTKPFSPRELVARVRAILRRHSVEPLAPSTSVAIIRSGSLILETATHTATLRGRSLSLTPTEFRLLRYLMANAGIVVSPAALLREVWGYSDPSGGGELVRTAVYRLRRKLCHARMGETAGPELMTIPGVGFLLQTTPAPGPALAAAAV